MNTPPDAPAIAQEGPRRLPQAQSGPYALIEALTAELRAVRGERDGIREALEGLIEWAVDAEKELRGPLPVGYRANVHKSVVFEKARALLASMDERSSNRGVEGV